MKLLEKLDYKLDKGGVFTLVSRSCTGKTTILCLLANELLMQGKNVAFITDSDDISVIANKFRNIIPSENELRGRLNIKNENINDINHIIKGLPQDIDVLILDGYFGNKENLKEHALKKQITIFETKLLRAKFLEGDVPFGESRQLMQRSDIVVKLSRNGNTQNLSFLDKLSNIFCFWLPKIVEKEKLLFEVLKNRRGKQVNFLYPIDFKEINEK